MFRAYALLACTLMPMGAWAVSNNAAARLEVPDPPMNTNGSLNGNLLTNETEFLTPDGIRDNLPQPDYVSELPPLEPAIPAETFAAQQTLQPALAEQLPQSQSQPLPQAAIEPAAGPADQASAIEPSAGLTIEAPETPSPTIIPATPQYVPNEVFVQKPRTTVVTRPGYVPDAATVTKTIVVPAVPVRQLIPAVAPEPKAGAQPEPMLGPDGNYYTPTSVDFLDTPAAPRGPETSDAPYVN